MLRGEFMIKRYPKLVMRIYDLKTKEEFKKYFSKRENLLGFFEEVPEFKLVISRIDSMDKVI